MHNLVNNFYQMTRNGADAKVVAQQIIMGNPQMRTMYEQMMNMSNGMSPQQFVMQYAKQNGISEADVVNTARNIGINI